MEQELAKNKKVLVSTKMQINNDCEPILSNRKKCCQQSLLHFIHIITCFLFGVIQTISKHQSNKKACSDQDWSWGSESAWHCLLWCSLIVGEFRESNGSLNELSGLLSQNLVWLLNHGLDDVDWVSPGAVSTSHLAVHLRNSSAKTVASVFFVHVHNTSPGKIFKHDSVVLDGIYWSFKDFAHWDDLTLTFSNLVLSFHLIPELGSSENSVLGKNSNSIAGWISILFAWQFSSYNPELSDLQYNEQKTY